MIPRLVLCSQALRNNCVFSTCAKVLQRPWTRHPGSPTATRCIHVDSPPVVPTLTTSYVHGTSSTSLLHTTVGESLLRTVERWPDQQAMAFLQDGVRKTFAQFQQDVDQAAAGLLALGLQKGDRLGMWGPNTYEWILMQFATAKAGIILVSVNPAYQLQEVEFALRKVGCKAIVCPTQFKTQKYCDMLRKICPEIESSAPGDIRSARCYQGTTGAPKGATLTHHNIVNNSYFIGIRVGYSWKHHIACIPVPLYHCFGSVGAGMCMAVHGLSLVFPSAGYDGRANLAAIESERCSFIYGTPTMYVDMINQPDLAKYDLSSAEAGIMAGSPCPPELMRKIVSVMGIKGMTIGYGTTENSPVTFLGSPTDNMERKSETVGFICDHIEAKIVDPSTGELLPLGTMGEILIRGYCVMPEYWGDEAKTQECITKEGWYKTGDIGRMDGFGYCRIEGRIKDMIIRGGENIYPAEIEQFLHTHPKVKEAQVVGVEDARMGEEVCACIKLIDGEECTVEEIKAYCKGQIAHFKIPRYILFVTSYPLTITGKIQKHKLRIEAEQQLGLKKEK
uniref:medium-chain acyl-CoA ligase ACSF2, mitochondrial n=1 Tax=Epinephelus lanceolatus TaxID=310571 RepID=UPI0014479BCE|nr:medium-chain acyl-CoA ligase ACSF2, mitochondrial [Epinephelus lanceolatus]